MGRRRVVPALARRRARGRAGGGQDPACARTATCASSPSSSTRPRFSHASGARSRANGAERFVAERRRYEERIRALFPRGRRGRRAPNRPRRRHGVRCSSSRRPTGPIPWLRPGAVHSSSSAARFSRRALLDGMRGHATRGQSSDPVPRVALIVNPYSTGVTKSRRCARSRLSWRCGRRRRTHARNAEGQASAAELAVAASAGRRRLRRDPRVLRRRHLQRGGERGGRAVSRSASCPAAARASFPRALGLPRGPAAAAARIAGALTAGRTRTISLGRVNGRLFLFSAGIGFDGEAVRRVDERRGLQRRRPAREQPGLRADDREHARRAQAADRAAARNRRLWSRGVRLRCENGRPYDVCGRDTVHAVAGGRLRGRHRVRRAPIRLPPVSLPRMFVRMLRGYGAR